MRTTTFSVFDYLPATLREFPKRRAAELLGLGALAGVGSLGLALLTWSVADPSLNHATNAPVHNLLGAPGAIAADLVMQLLGARLYCRSRPARLLGLATPDRAPAPIPAAENRPLPRRDRGNVGARFAPAGARKLAAADGSWRGRRRRDACAAAPAALRRSVGDGGQRRGFRGARNSGAGRGRRGRFRPSSATPKTERRAARPRAPGRRPAWTTRRRKTSRASAWSRSAPPSMRFSRVKAALRRLVRRRSKSAPDQPAALPGLAASPAPWMSLRIDEDLLNKPSDFAPRAKGAPPAPRPGRRSVLAPPAGPLKAAAPVQAKFAFTPARRLDHAVDHDADRAEEIRRRKNLA